MRVTRRLVSLLAIATLVALPASLPALAQSGTAENITHRQSVLTEVSPEGETGTSRVFTQLTVVGDGQVEVALPNQSTQGLRNLEGFGRPRVEGDQVVHEVEASRDGTAERTVADSTVDLPIQIDISYELDGEPVEPRDLVGESGELTATFTVRNTTAQPTEVRYFDGRQNPQRETIDVAVPFVGSLSMNLDGRFVDVDAPAASVAGDGRGNTTVSWSLVLFEPVGSEEQTVRYTAHVTDAIVPEMVGQFLPVDSTSFGSLKSVQETFGDVAEGLTSLTTGALILDGNVKLLADGASQLLDGLGQLSDGADQLAAGLNDTAVPGSRQLADGMGEARTGGRQLADGLLELGSGAGQLSTGLGQARTGSGDLSSGLGRLARGAGDLSDGLGAARSGTGTLVTGIDGLAGGIGQPGDTAEDGTVIGGLNSLRAGIAALPASAQEGLSAGLEEALQGLVRPQLVDGVEAGLQQGLQGQLRPGIVAGVEEQLETNLNATLQGQVRPGIVTGIRTNVPPLLAAGIEGQLFSGMQGQVDLTDPEATTGLAGFLFSQVFFDPADPAGAPAAAAQAEGLAKAYFDAVKASSAAEDFSAGAAEGIANTLDPQLEATFEAVAAGFAAGFARGEGVEGDGFDGSLRTAFDQFIAAFVYGTGVPDSDGFDGSLEAAFDTFAVQFAAAYREGLDASLEKQALPGFDRLLAGLDNPRCDTANPTDPANPCGIRQVLQLLGVGSRDLRSGLGQLEAGGRQLAAGAGEAELGSRSLNSGLIQLDDGGRQLAAGADTAANGANDLANGLVQLDDGANQLASGLVDAGDGAGQIAEGLESAEEGGEQIADGTQAVTDQGMSQIIDGASDGAMTPALAVAHAKAADARGMAGEGLPYGTVDGAEASAVYKFEIAGIGGQDEGPSTPVRAAATLAAFGVAGALGLGLRRVLV
jgi:putative membrane protein